MRTIMSGKMLAILSATTAALVVGVIAHAQNLDVKGTSTVENNGYFYGSVGIGTTSPAYPLDVTGVIRAGAASLGASLYGNWPTLAFNATWSSSGWLFGPGSSNQYAGMIEQNPANGVLLINASSNAGNTGAVANWATNLALLPNGNVGIGTNSPSATLQVNGEIRQTACAAGQTYVYDNLCVDSSDHAATTVNNAQLTCIQQRGHLCREDELIAVCTALGDGQVTTGSWMNNTTGDDLYKNVNNAGPCGNIDGPGINGRTTNEPYRCCYGLGK